MAMLKITTVKTDRRCRLVLDGELVSPWVAELEKEWRNARVSAGGLSLIVDLRNVITISQEGKDILFDMMGEGVRFVCGGILNRHVLQQLARKVVLLFPRDPRDSDVAANVTHQIADTGRHVEEQLRISSLRNRPKSNSIF
jgi:hypothetical protein